MNQVLNAVVYGIKWVANQVEQLTAAAVAPALLVLAVLAPTALQVVVIVVGLTWVAAKILKRLPGGKV